MSYNKKSYLPLVLILGCFVIYSCKSLTLNPITNVTGSESNPSQALQSSDEGNDTSGSNETNNDTSSDKSTSTDIVSESWKHEGSSNGSVSNACFGVANSIKTHGMPPVSGGSNQVGDGAEKITGLGTGSSISFNGYECYDATEYMCQIEYWVFTKTNQIRKSLGVRELVNNKALSYLARQWSAYQAGVGLTHHNGQKNEACLVALIQKKFLDMRPFSNPSYSGENCYGIYGFGPNNRNPESVADYLVKGWKESPGHYQTMTDGRYSHIGVGVVQSYDSSLPFAESQKDLYFGTQEFSN